MKIKILSILFAFLLISSIAGVYATIEHDTNIDTLSEADNESATVITNASSGDCGNVTFKTEGDNYESYCVEKGKDVPEIGMVYTVEENLTSNSVITYERAQKIKIFSINYRNNDLTHNTINPKTGNPVKEIDDVTSRQLIIWDILGQADNGWYEHNYVNKTIIDHINELYNNGLTYDDKGFVPLNDTHQLNYTFKYFSSRESYLQDFLGWFFVESDIPPQENKTNNTTNETEPVDNQTDDFYNNKTMDENNTEITNNTNNAIIDDNANSTNAGNDNKITIPILNTGSNWGLLVLAILIVVCILLIRRL